MHGPVLSWVFSELSAPKCALLSKIRNGLEESKESCLELHRLGFESWLHRLLSAAS